MLNEVLANTMRELDKREETIRTLTAELEQYKKPAGIVDSWQVEAETNRQAWLKAETQLEALAPALRTLRETVLAYGEGYEPEQDLLDVCRALLAALHDEAPRE